MQLVFVAVGHRSAECAGLHVAHRITRFEALELIRQGVRQRFGGFAAKAAGVLSVRHDHGSQYMSDAFQAELAFLGIASSLAFVRAPEGNGFAERFICTLKENVLWVKRFDTVGYLRGRCWRSARRTTSCGWLRGTVLSRRSRPTAFTRGPGRGNCRSASHNPRAIHGDHLSILSKSGPALITPHERPVYRSTSPKTMSRVPSTHETSASM
ncbi:hypothetical protein MPEAHAMD_5818 [Methylobacterium frigidaeris]|uniref:Integrase catalytic domain-containing protein n=1 Tax=Methylobacterium frigidaeris TaxID=2038277 RepID=A0AA37HH24_9HYPH|nr:hypothetical protein MPEAHAMD_5818 [Methylobacterium frigidaeris]